MASTGDRSQDPGLAFRLLRPASVACPGRKAHTSDFLADIAQAPSACCLVQPETTVIDAPSENRAPSPKTLRIEEQRLARIRWLLETPTYTANEELAGLYLKAVGLAAAHADV
jgi:hypothetical protein